ncbi:MAG: hypothetical protein AAGA56_19785 [Myxococcota bacterium]
MKTITYCSIMTLAAALSSGACRERDEPKAGPEEPAQSAPAAPKDAKQAGADDPQAGAVKAAGANPAEAKGGTITADGGVAPQVQKPSAAGPLTALFVGAPPDEVKLIKGHADSYNGWAIKYPAGWATSTYQVFMLMKRTSDAAVLCGHTGAPYLHELHVKPGHIKELAKRAPLLGKNLEAEGEESRLKMGKLETEVRVGHMKGELFKTAESDLFWWDVRYRGKGKAKTDVETMHMYCVAGLKAGADEATRTQFQAVVRSFEPPSKGTVIEPQGPPAKKPE